MLVLLDQKYRSEFAEFLPATMCGRHTGWGGRPIERRVDGRRGSCWHGCVGDLRPECRLSIEPDRQTDCRRGIGNKPMAIIRTEPHRIENAVTAATAGSTRCGTRFVGCAPAQPSATLGSSFPITCIVYGPCRRAMATFPAVGVQSKSLSKRRNAQHLRVGGSNGDGRGGMRFAFPLYACCALPF